MSLQQIETTAFHPLSFENKPVRVVTRDDEPWFVATDVCRVLDLENSRQVVRVLDEDEKGVHNLDTLGGVQPLTIVSEPGLYKLLGRSRKPEAKRFDRWVRHEVLPSIRKTGSYSAPLTPNQIMAQAVLIAERTMKEQAEQIAVLAPKAEAHDRIADAEGAICITDAAKALGVRPKDLFRWMSANGWIYRRAGGATWLGYSARTNAGDLTHVVTTKPINGEERIFERVLVTAKGLTRLAKLGPISPAGALRLN
jgi:anti-repressor protein